MEKKSQTLVWAQTFGPHYIFVFSAEQCLFVGSPTPLECILSVRLRLQSIAQYQSANKINVC